MWGGGASDNHRHHCSGGAEMKDWDLNQGSTSHQGSRGSLQCWWKNKLLGVFITSINLTFPHAPPSSASLTGPLRTI